MDYKQIQVNTQSSIRIEGSRVVYFDPFRIGRESHDADLICITHAHYDHFDLASIEKVSGRNTELAAPASMAKELGNLGWKGKLHLLAPGERLEAAGLTITAVPAYNKLKPFHPKHNGWIGYLLEMDGIRYYVAGDTDAIKPLQEIRCDIALVPIGGKFTMNAKEAAGLINQIKPAAESYRWKTVYNEIHMECSWRIILHEFFCLKCQLVAGVQRFQHMRFTPLRWQRVKVKIVIMILEH